MWDFLLISVTDSTELKTKAIKTKGYSVLAARILKSLKS